MRHISTVISEIDISRLVGVLGNGHQDFFVFFVFLGKMSSIEPLRRHLCRYSKKCVFWCRQGSLVDQMVQMLEKHANHLEELVAERTAQLEVEQQRTEELLCSMIPR